MPQPHRVSARVESYPTCSDPPHARTTAIASEPERVEPSSRCAELHLEHDGFALRLAQRRGTRSSGIVAAALPLDAQALGVSCAVCCTDVAAVVKATQRHTRACIEHSNRDVPSSYRIDEEGRCFALP